MTVDIDLRSAHRAEGDRPFFVSLADAATWTFPSPPEGERQWVASGVVRDYFGQSSATKILDPVPGPQAFLVEVFPCHAIAGAHFHDTNQFQIFYPAEGVYYQRRAIIRPLLHYTDAYSTYGPFGAGQNAMSFHTLRQTAASITAYMPRDRSKLIRRPGRNLMAEISSPEPPADRDIFEISPILEAAEDGLAAYSVRGGPFAEMLLPTAEHSGGQYLCILSGRVLFEEREFGSRSVGWAGSTSRQATVTAGEDGAHILTLQFPRLR